jgi:hypothetical protein
MAAVVHNQLVVDHTLVVAALEDYNTSLGRQILVEVALVDNTLEEVVHCILEGCHIPEDVTLVDLDDWCQDQKVVHLELVYKQTVLKQHHCMMVAALHRSHRLVPTFYFQH